MGYSEGKKGSEGEERKGEERESCESWGIVELSSEGLNTLGINVVCFDVFVYFDIIKDIDFCSVD